jgi:transposase-like protein
MEGSTVRKAHKSYSAQEKLTILRRHLLDKVSILRLRTELQLQPTVFYRWLKQLFDDGAAALRLKLTTGKRPDTRQRGITRSPGNIGGP